MSKTYSMDEVGDPYPDPFGQWVKYEDLNSIQAEVERLRETEKKLRVINHSLKDDQAIYFSRNLELEQERDQLKVALNELHEFSFENLIEAVRLEGILKDNGISSEPTGVVQTLAAHDAEVIEQVASELAIKARDECSRVEYQSGYLAAVNDAFTAAIQLRQQTKESSDD